LSWTFANLATVESSGIYPKGTCIIIQLKFKSLATQFTLVIIVVIALIALFIIYSRIFKHLVIKYGKYFGSLEINKDKMRRRIER
jgi:uncharacterized membrane protein YobD (UPF0266 family)